MSVFMGNALKSIFQIGNSKYNPAPWAPPRPFANPGGIGNSLEIYEISNIALKPAQSISYQGWGKGGGETPSCLRIFHLFFYDPEEFQ